MRWWWRLVLGWLAAIVIGFSSASSTRRSPGHNLIVLLLDGFGAELLNRTDLEATFGLRHLAENGVLIQRLRPVYPSQSLPNWHSLATGLHTENHGFTSDYMFDPVTGMQFERGLGVNDTDDLWWQDRPDPIWYTAGKAGIDVHCYWFSSCHMAHVDMVVQVPSHRRYNASQPEQTEALTGYFPTIVEHIRKYQSYRQQLFLLRYGGVESAFRKFGRDSEELDQAVARADMHVQELQQKMDEHNLFDTTNLVILSSHGLHNIDGEEQFFIEECLADFSKIRKIVNSHSMLMVFVDPEEEDAIFFELKVCDQWAPLGDYDEDDQPLVSVYRSSELPERLFWKHSRFMSPIVIITRPGVTVLSRELPALPAMDEELREMKATSGWDNEFSKIQGVLLARGPAFKINHKLADAKIVDIFPLMLSVLGVKAPHKHNGTWDTVQPALADGWQHHPDSQPGGAERTSSSGALVVCLIIMRMLSLR